MDASENSGTPKSSILIGFLTINHPFWGTTLFLETLICLHWFVHVVVFFCVFIDTCFLDGLRVVQIDGAHRLGDAIVSEINRSETLHVQVNSSSMCQKYIIRVCFSITLPNMGLRKNKENTSPSPFEGVRNHSDS